MDKCECFFIVGAQRSGTTLLSALLANHPAIHMRRSSVAFRLITCFKNYQNLLDQHLVDTNEAENEWLKQLIQNDYKGRLAQLIDCDKLDQYDNIHALIQQSIIRQIKQNNQSVWGDKAPGLEHYLADMRLLLPEAKFIHLVRDGRAVAASSHKRSYKHILLSAQQWVDGNTIGLANQRLIGKAQYLFVQYEQLLRSPQKVAREICTFLQIPFSAQMLQLDNNEASQSPNAYVGKKLDTSKIHQYQSDLSPRIIKQIERIQGPLLQRFDYDLLSDVSNFQLLSNWQRIRYNQWQQLQLLFKGRREGMEDWQVQNNYWPFGKRLRIWLSNLARDFLSARMVQSMRRKQKY